MSEFDEYQNVLVFLPLMFWLLCSVYWMLAPESIRTAKYIKSIPAGFTTTGVLGTFLGIVVGLYQFDVDDIQSSIPLLLNGLKGAFLTSILGIILSMISQKIIESFLVNERSVDSTETRELRAIVGLLNQSNKENPNEILEKIHSELVELKKETTKINGGQTTLVEEIKQNRYQAELNLKQSVKATNSGFEKQYKGMQANSDRLIESLEENYRNLSKHLAEMNSKELLKAMEDSVKIFNDKMESILSRLIKENFDALNKSVNQLNDWQVQHKNNVDSLVGKLGVLIDKHQDMSGVMDTTTAKVEKNLTKASGELDKVAKRTTDLVKDNGRLQKIVAELESVLLGENQLKAIFDKSQDSVDKINVASESFSKGMKTVEDIQKNLFRTSESLVEVINELQELAKLKDLNDSYWKDVESKMNEGISILKNGNNILSGELETINSEFKGNLNETFVNLDKLIKFYIARN